jgi:hypothetical protein
MLFLTRLLPILALAQTPTLVILEPIKIENQDAGKVILGGFELTLIGKTGELWAGPYKIKDIKTDQTCQGKTDNPIETVFYVESQNRIVFVTAQATEAASKVLELIELKGCGKPLPPFKGKAKKIELRNGLIYLEPVCKCLDGTTPPICQCSPGHVLELSPDGGFIRQLKKSKLFTEMELGVDFGDSLEDRTVKSPGTDAAEFLEEQKANPSPLPSSTPLPVVEEVKEATGKPKGTLELGFFYSIMNSYKRGNLDTYFGNVVGDSSRAADQGSPTLMGIEYFFANRIPGSPIELAGGGSTVLGNSRGIWGTKIVFGGNAVIKLKPFFMTAALSIRYYVSETYFVGVEPALVMGWVSGTLTEGTNSTEFGPSPALGFQIAFPLEWCMNPTFSLTTKIGMRLFKAPLFISSSNAFTAHDPVVNGEEVKADLSGSFGLMGVKIKF